MWRARRVRGRLTHQVAFPAEGAASWSDAERATAQGSALSAMSLLRQAVRQDPRHAYAVMRLADLLIQRASWREVKPSCAACRPTCRATHRCTSCGTG